MTIQEFDRLSDLGKEKELDIRGRVVQEEIYRGRKVVVYQVDGFLVEVQYELHAPHRRHPDRAEAILG